MARERSSTLERSRGSTNTTTTAATTKQAAHSRIATDGVRISSTATTAPSNCPTVSPMPRYASARDRNLSGMRSPNAAAIGADSITYPICTRHHSSVRITAFAAAPNGSVNSAATTPPPRIHGVRRPSSVRVWSDSTATTALDSTDITTPKTISSASGKVRPTPANRSTSTGRITVFSAPSGAAHSTAPAANPMFMRVISVAEGR